MIEYPNYLIEKAKEIEKRSASLAGPFAYDDPKGLEHYLFMACLEKLHEFSNKSEIHKANTRDLLVSALELINEDIGKLDLNSLGLTMATSIIRGGVEDLLSCLVATIKSGLLGFDELITHGPDSGLIKLLKAFLIDSTLRNADSEVCDIFGLLSEHLRQQRKAELIEIYQSIFDPLLRNINSYYTERKNSGLMTFLGAIKKNYGGKRELVEAFEDLCLAYEGGSTPTIAGIEPRMAARACYKLIFELSGKADREASEYELYLHYRLSPDEWQLLEQGNVIRDERFNYYRWDGDGEDFWQIEIDLRDCGCSFDRIICRLFEYATTTTRGLNQLCHRGTGVPEYYLYKFGQHLSHWLEHQGKPYRYKLEVLHEEFKSFFAVDRNDDNIQLLTRYEDKLAKLGTDSTRFPGDYQAFCDCYDKLVALIHEAHSLDYLQKATECTYALPDALLERGVTSINNNNLEEARTFLVRLNERHADGKSIYPPRYYSLIGDGIDKLIEIEKRLTRTREQQNHEIEKEHLKMEAETEKRKTIEHLMAIISHQFRGALGTILFNTEHENDKTVYVHTARAMSGMVDIAGVLSTSPESLQANLARDEAGQATPLSTLTSSLRDLIVDLTSQRNRERLSPYYKSYAQRQGWVSPDLTLSEWCQTGSCQQYEQTLQAEWDAASHILIHADIGALQRWMEQRWLPLHITGFDEDDSSFSDYGPKASLLRVILTEILKNAIKHSDPNAARPILLEWSNAEVGLSIRCTNHSTRATRMREKSKGSGRGLQFLRMIASNLGGKLDEDLYSEPSSVCIHLNNWPSRGDS